MAELFHNGQPTGLQLELAEGFFRRALGLLGRSSLAEDRGLWIRRCARVHTFAMRFTIDVLMVDRDGQIVSIATVPPWRAGPPGAAGGDAVELAAGTASRLGLELGDLLTVETPCARLARTTPSEDSIHP